MSSALMVVASLIATMAFQVAINPPGSVWQDNSNSGAGAPQSSERPHSAGSAILSDKNPSSYSLLMNFNTTGFMASVSIMLLQISGLPIGRKFLMWILLVIMWIAISAMTFTYIYTLIFLTEQIDETLDTGLGTAGFIWLGLMGILFLGHVIRLIKKMIKCVRKSIRQPRQPSSNMA
ncbi:hypothetical protein EZV62_013199 [Acer yangbiense]|uniref:PGG domain-containing protein n=1 Tax=Acer yangbiense TaxID=1000413 RepID=A0A5C7HZL4_9ROSI|nr:hypothetical protein EZV62_013199 [Acer yangbiense]